MPSLTQREARAWLRAQVRDDDYDVRTLRDLVELAWVDAAHQPMLVVALQSGRMHTRAVDHLPAAVIQKLARIAAREACVLSAFDPKDIHQTRVRALAAAGIVATTGAQRVVAAERSVVVRELGIMALDCAPALDDAVSAVIAMLPDADEAVVATMWDWLTYQLTRINRPMAPSATTAVAVRLAIAMPAARLVELLEILVDFYGERFAELARRHEPDLHALMARALGVCPDVVFTLLAYLDGDKYVDLLVEALQRNAVLPETWMTERVLATLDAPHATDETRALCQRMPPHGLRRVWSPDMALEQALFKYARTTGDPHGLRAFMRGFCGDATVEAMLRSADVATLAASMSARYRHHLAHGDEALLRQLHPAPSCDVDALHAATQRVLNDGETCPITQLPIVVCATDAHGRAFERDYLIAWVARDQRNPICRTPMSVTDVRCEYGLGV